MERLDTRNRITMLDWPPGQGEADVSEAVRLRRGANLEEPQCKTYHFSTCPKPEIL